MADGAGRAGGRRRVWVEACNMALALFSNCKHNFYCSYACYSCRDSRDVGGFCAICLWIRLGISKKNVAELQCDMTATASALIIHEDVALFELQNAREIDFSHFFFVLGEFRGCTKWENVFRMHLHHAAVTKFVSERQYRLRSQLFRRFCDGETNQNASIAPWTDFSQFPCLSFLIHEPQTKIFPVTLRAPKKFAHPESSFPSTQHRYSCHASNY